MTYIIKNNIKTKLIDSLSTLHKIIHDINNLYKNILNIECLKKHKVVTIIYLLGFIAFIFMSCLLNHEILTK